MKDLRVKLCLFNVLRCPKPLYNITHVYPKKVVLGGGPVNRHENVVVQTRMIKASSTA